MTVKDGEEIGVITGEGVIGESLSNRYWFLEMCGRIWLEIMIVLWGWLASNGDICEATPGR